MGKRPAGVTLAFEEKARACVPHVISAAGVIIISLVELAFWSQCMLSRRVVTGRPSDVDILEKYIGPRTSLGRLNADGLRTWCV